MGRFCYADIMQETHWEPHHTIIDGQSDRQDGRLFIRDVALQLDIAAMQDECVLSEEKDKAAAAWEAGTVFLSQDTEQHGVSTLVLPFDALTDELVVEALRSFNP
jgi:hypothetical protein